MASWEAATETWRKQTIAACEASLDAARAQVAESRAATLRLETTLRRGEAETAALRASIKSLGREVDELGNLLPPPVPPVAPVTPLAEIQSPTTTQGVTASSPAEALRPVQAALRRFSAQAGAAPISGNAHTHNVKGSVAKEKEPKEAPPIPLPSSRAGSGHGSTAGTPYSSGIGRSATTASGTGSAAKLRAPLLHSSSAGHGHADPHAAASPTPVQPPPGISGTRPFGSGGGSQRNLNRSPRVPSSAATTAQTPASAASTSGHTPSQHHPPHNRQASLDSLLSVSAATSASAANSTGDNGFLMPDVIPASSSSGSLGNSPPPGLRIVSPSATSAASIAESIAALSARNAAAARAYAAATAAADIDDANTTGTQDATAPNQVEPSSSRDSERPPEAPASPHHDAIDGEGPPPPAPEAGDSPRSTASRRSAFASSSASTTSSHQARATVIPATTEESGNGTASSLPTSLHPVQPPSAALRHSPVIRSSTHSQASQGQSASEASSAHTPKPDLHYATESTTQPTSGTAPAGGSPTPSSAVSAAAPSVATATAPSPGGRIHTTAVADAANTGNPPRPPAVSERLYDTIIGMSVPALRSMLMRAGIPFGDCVEKRELQDRLLVAVEKGQDSRAAKAGAAATSASPGGSQSARAPEQSSTASADTSTSGSVSARPSNSNNGGHGAAGDRSSTRKGANPQQVRAPYPMSRSSTGNSTGSGNTSTNDAPAAMNGVATEDSTPVPSVAVPTPRETSAQVNNSGNSGNVDDEPQSPSQHTEQNGVSKDATGTKVGSPQELKNWLPAKAPDGATYYYHRITRAVRWDKPDIDIARKMEAVSDMCMYDEGSLNTTSVLRVCSASRANTHLHVNAKRSALRSLPLPKRPAKLRLSVGRRWKRTWKPESNDGPPGKMYAKCWRR